MGRTMPTECQHGVMVGGGDFAANQRCVDCERIDFKRSERVAAATIMAADVIDKAVLAERAQRKVEHERLLSVTHRLREYSRHAPFCAYAPTYPDAPIATCDCGFDAVLDDYDRWAAL